ncbi:MAG: CoA transferase, partial [Hyphomicrobiales bacterium]
KTIEGNGPEDGPPMMGVRVIDLTMGWAGPLVTRQLADLGADIIKVEACQYPDWWRGTDFRPAALHDRLYEKRPPFLVMNRNKRGITLDLTSAEGVELLKKLVAGADAVIENYSSEVLTKLGISYDVLCGIKPDLVMLSMPAFGRSGKLADVRAYGSTLEHASALPSVVGVDGWPPTSSHLALGDPIGGLNATAALLVGLFHRRQTGHGQRIDMSQVECLFPLVAPWIIEQSLSGKVSARRGNRHKLFAPQGCYQCSGIDQWVVISVTTDAEWVTLAKMIDSSALATDKDLKTAQGRQAAHDHIDLILTAWTRSRRAQNVVHDFQQAGICAAVVQSPFELVDDRHLAAREYWQFIDRRISGSNQPHPSFPVRFELGPIKVKSAAPLLGQHNEEVLAGVGVERDRISALRLAGIVGEEATPAHLRSAQAAQT